MAGPCSVESRTQLFETADAVADAGATILRGGAFKPRTSPYSFQGLGVEALRDLAEARERTGLPVITEVMEPNQVDIVAEYADILQVGTRNMQNFSLLMAVGRVARPVMLKRGFSATVEEWLMAAEYIVSSGNPNVILCERGIRTFETYTRNTLDLSAVPLLRQLTHLPVIVDPSHATGKRWLVAPLAIGGVAVGADGVMVEVHPDPDAGPLRRRAAAHVRPVPLDDGPARAGPRAGPRPAERADRAPSRRGVGGRRRARPALMTTTAPSTPDAAVVERAARLRGELRLPGDKSISHRALMLATLAAGESRIRARATGRTSARRRRSAGALGATVERIGGDDRDRASPRRRSTTGSSRRASTGSASRRRTSTAATPGRASGCSPGSSPACRSGPSSTATIHCGAVRSLVSSNRFGRWARRVHARADDSLPPLTVIGRHPLVAVDRLDPRPERPGQVGDPAGGAPGGRLDDRPRGGRDARPHGADAAGARDPVRTERLADDASDGAEGAVAITIEGGSDGAGDRRAGSRRRVGGRVLARRRAPSTPTRT